MLRLLVHACNIFVRMKTYHLLSFLLLMFVLQLSCTEGKRKAADGKQRVLYIINSSHAESKNSSMFLMPYMAHFGIPFDTLDLSGGDVPNDLQQFNLIIFSHKDLANGDAQLKKRLEETVSGALKEGCGVVSFDPSLGAASEKASSAASSADTLDFSSEKHFITNGHKPGERLKLFGTLSVPASDGNSGKSLIAAGNSPLLYIREENGGRLAQWTSAEWMQLKVLGPLGGLDDCLWRSIVWAAKKPFVMRGLPPIVTMRVDDVAGSGERWNKSPLYWVGTANKYGLKPWLGLFIYNLNPAAIEELRGYILSGNAVAFPHGFGRPMRKDNPPIGSKSRYVGQRPGQEQLSEGLYYNPKALPLRALEDDEYIYFDHHNARPWSDAEAKRGMEAVDQWYKDNQPLPMSKYFLAHWGEVGSNVAEHMKNKWGIEFISYKKPADKPWADTILWVKKGPFRLYEKQGTSTNATTPGLMGGRPTYYADFIEINGYEFFNCVTEIKDVAGYEWAPDNDVKATADRGIRMLSRALNSMAPAFLFTHETDFIYRITPENWDKELQLVTEGIKSFNPIYLTIDDGVRLVRCTKTSTIGDIQYNNADKSLRVGLTGKTDMESYFYLFTENDGEVRHELVKIPVFNGKTEVHTSFK
jgi:hypothetical protein